jgi:uncharacterized membrane protein YdjX (TVP38/TMEM64 family)
LPEKSVFYFGTCVSSSLRHEAEKAHLNQETLGDRGSLYPRPNLGAVAASVVVPALLLGLFHYLSLDSWFQPDSAQGWSSLGQEFSPMAAPVLLVTFVLFAATGLPRLYPAILAGSLIGVEAGFVVAVAGATLGSVISFQIARKLGRQRLVKPAGVPGADWSRRFDRYGFQLVLLLRLTPGMNSLMTTGLAGVMGVRLYSFTTATLIGIIPSTISYIAIGESLSAGITWKAGVSLGLLILLAACSLLISRDAARKMS